MLFCFTASTIINMMAKNTARYFKNFSNDYVYTVGFAQNICRPGRNSTRVRRKQRLINELEPGSKITYLITHLNNFNLPLNGGYFTSGSNQVGVFITAFYD